MRDRRCRSRCRRIADHDGPSAGGPRRPRQRCCVRAATLLADAGPPAAGCGVSDGRLVGSYVLDRRFGLADGFDSYDDGIRRNPGEGARLEAKRRGGDVVDGAVAWLNQSTSPFFLWVHPTIRMRRTNLRLGMRKKRMAIRDKRRGRLRGCAGRADRRGSPCTRVAIDGRGGGRQSWRGAWRARRADASHARL